MIEIIQAENRKKLSALKILSGVFFKPHSNCIMSLPCMSSKDADSDIKPLRLFVIYDKEMMTKDDRLFQLANPWPLIIHVL